MNAKEYLEQVKQIDDDIQMNLLKKEELYSVLTDASAKLGGERVQTSLDGDKFGKVFSKIDEVENKINDLIDQYVDFKAKVVDEICRVSEKKYAELLIHRYIEYKGLQEVGEIMGYSYDWVKELHGKALEDFENVINPPKTH